MMIFSDNHKIKEVYCSEVSVREAESGDEKQIRDYHNGERQKRVLG